MNKILTKKQVLQDLESFEIKEYNKNYSNMPQEVKAEYIELLENNQK